MGIVPLPKENKLMAMSEGATLAGKVFPAEEMKLLEILFSTSL